MKTPEEPTSKAERAIDPTSICIVGSGPIGLAFALRLANGGQSVTLIDSGKFAERDQGHELNFGTVVGAAKAKDRSDPTLLEDGIIQQYLNHDYLSFSRYLGSGGSAWRWGVRSRPTAQQHVRIVPGALADFEARPELDIPGWAASATDIYDRYPDALTFLGLGSQTFKIADYQDALDPFPLPSQLLPTKLFHFARADVIRHQRLQDVLNHPGIDVRSGLHLLRIETDKQERVTALIACDRQGNEVRLAAKHYVLALGGIKNARQLLIAKDEGALADPHDVFGRWFCDHPHVRLGYLTGAGDDALARAAAWYDFQDVQGVPVLRGHELTPAAARDREMLRFSVDLVGRPGDYCSRSGIACTKAIDALKQKDFKTLLASVPGLASSPMRTLRLAHLVWKTSVHGTHLGGWSDPSTRQHGVEILAVEAMFEQRPSPDNRIRLSKQRNRLGLPRPVLQWSWSRKEVDAINRSRELMAEAFDKAGVAPFVSMRDLGQGEIPRAGSGFHHMGGTRQSQDPAEGVVNAENRVHGVENLTLIGCSVFPNSVGYANPTLTAIADALRVADLFLAST
ncbi:GMC oxidoreductase [Nodosilinea sp. P-1105]|uniref:GMC oxidoreductase n=1 Tax=Nodosilinea sp. P-1105 TaxID=2546229 RepID=UPI00146EA978|nr:GMC oxidoreductase [Nodosilinea sp. P-1105]